MYVILSKEQNLLEIFYTIINVFTVTSEKKHTDPKLLNNSVVFNGYPSNKLEIHSKYIQTNLMTRTRLHVPEMSVWV